MDFEINDNKITATSGNEALAKAIVEKMNQRFNTFEKNVDERITTIEKMVPEWKQYSGVMQSVAKQATEQEAIAKAQQEEEAMATLMNKAVEANIPAIATAIGKAYGNGEGNPMPAKDKEGGDVEEAGESDTDLNGSAKSVTKADDMKSKDKDEDDDMEGDDDEKTSMAKSVTESVLNLLQERGLLGVTKGETPATTAPVAEATTTVTKSDKGEVGGSSVDPLTAAGAGTPLKKSVAASEGASDGRVRLDQIFSVSDARRLGLNTRAGSA